MEPHEIGKMTAEFGLMAAMVWLFVQFMLNRMKASDVQSQERETRIAGRVTQLETFINTELLDLVRGSTEAIVKNTEALNLTHKALLTAEERASMAHEATTMLIKELKIRPCLLPSEE